MRKDKTANTSRRKRTDEIPDTPGQGANLAQEAARKATSLQFQAQNQMRCAEEALRVAPNSPDAIDAWGRAYDRFVDVACFAGDARLYARHATELARVGWPVTDMRKLAEKAWWDTDTAFNAKH